jgi:hypothetical protein
MALIKCKECGSEVSNGAKTCPKCGAPIPKGTSIFTWFATFIFILIIFQVITPKSDATIEPAPKTAEQPQPWVYETDTDKMSGKESKFAKSVSTNSHDLQFPYQGGTNMTITLRKHPRMGVDAYISVNKGQLDTNYDGTIISVKFDDKPLVKFSMNSPDDGSRDTLFFQNQKRFIENIKKAKRVIIEAQFYHDGNRQFEFNTENLVWAK